MENETRRRWENHRMHRDILRLKEGGEYRYKRRTLGFAEVCHTTKEDEQELYLLVEEENVVPFPTINSSSLLNKMKPLNINLDDFSSKFIKVIASSNGLMCLVLSPWNYMFYICNPVTREVLKLPEPPGLDSCFNTNKLEYMYPTSSGFAFHAPTMEYKVVRTWYFKAIDTGLIYTGIEIYTIGSGELWRRIDKQDIISTSTLRRLPTSQVFLNGALHWELEDLTKPQFKHSIGVVHIGDEKFTSLEIPPVDVGVKFRTLISLRQCLCLTDDFKDHMILWIMKSYGVARSWTRLYFIRKARLGPLQTLPFIGVKTLKNGSILLSGGGYHGYYDFDKHEFKQIFIDSPPERLDIVVHIASLISPATIAGKGEEYRAQSTPRRPIRFTLKRKAKKLLTASCIFGN
ncbi:hypothetical protein AQUCO_00600125v1 [Aquilegia coerulea]|uniref:F-box associated beta-propeller type 3 domain-containing protein n=1 Tax=Aquilegia coerulea TaxID=218851 RepID=A0A2G5EN16_AQUCA|nr:hypothetical protein AQUCO_00600125v1 [Aquilegia coerulea]